MADPVTAQGLEELLDEHAAVFGACYDSADDSADDPGGGAPPRLFFSPGRVNLFGGHLDYNGGPVMPTAIDRGTFFAVRERSDRRVLLASTHDPHGIDFDLDDPPTTRRDRWVDYPLGVFVDLIVRARGRGQTQGLCGLEVMFGGNLPVGSGLSSSASICVGTAFVLDRLWDLELGVDERVACALRAERGFVGVQCGIMDPYAVGYARPGHLLWLDCKDEGFEHLPLDPKRLAILVANTGVKRELAASEFNKRVSQCRAAFEALAPHAPGAEVLRDVSAEVLAARASELDPVLRKRAQHVVAEVARTFEARAAVLEGDLERMGGLMSATHESLRNLYEVSCPELDCLVQAACAAEGAFGSRLTGAGFGGCTVALVEPEAAQSVTSELQACFEQRFGRTPEVEVFGGDQGPREFA
jgi:galactokinase